jgi:hypothetical protein
MDINLEKLKSDFNTIQEIRSKVTIIFTILENHLNKLKQTYLSFVTNNTQNLFIFGLDSFQFQSKLLDIEYADMKRLFLAINNKMYCEYYKLYNIIVEYIKENISNKKIQEIIKANNFPTYKDLEPFKQYNFEIIQEIHENIILLLYSINDCIVNKEIELQMHTKKQQIGLNINNFVTTFNYNILMIREKGALFISYIHFFHSLHTKYLQRFSMKMNLLYSQITHDINFDETTSSSKKEMLDNFEEFNIDKDLIKEIKRSVEDSETSKSHSPASSIRSELTNNVEDIPVNSSKIFKNIKNVMSKINIFANAKSPRIIDCDKQDAITIPTLNLLSLGLKPPVITEEINMGTQSNRNAEYKIEDMFELVSNQCELIQSTSFKTNEMNHNNNDVIVEEQESLNVIIDDALSVLTIESGIDSIIHSVLITDTNTNTNNNTDTNNKDTDTNNKDTDTNTNNKDTDTNNKDTDTNNNTDTNTNNNTDTNKDADTNNNNDNDTTIKLTKKHKKKKH